VQVAPAVLVCIGVLIVLGAGLLLSRPRAPVAADGAPPRPSATPVPATARPAAAGPAVSVAARASPPAPSPTPAVAAETPVALASLAPIATETESAGCEPGADFAELVRALGEETVGLCVEAESVNLTTGDAQQRTTRGLLVRRKDGGVAFTDGGATWDYCAGTPARRSSREGPRC